MPQILVFIPMQSDCYVCAVESSLAAHSGLENFSLQLISPWSLSDIGDMTVKWLDMLTMDRSVNYNNHKSKCGCIEIARYILIVGVGTVICSHKEENWKLSLLAENLSCAQISIVVLVAVTIAE